MSEVETNVVAGEGVAEVEATPVVEAVAKKEGNIPGELFVEVWNTSASRSEVRERFKAIGYNLEYGSLIARAKSFKAKGVDLKEMPREKTVGRKGKTLDVAKLNAVAARVKADAAAVAAAAKGEASAS